MTHDPRYDDLRDDIPAYALGGLSLDEAQAIEEHLRDCETCREELASYTSVPHLLNLASDDAAIPEGAKERLISRVGPTPTPRDVSRETTVSTTVPSRRPVVPTWMLAAASLVLIALLGAGFVQQSRKAAEQQATIDSVVDLMERPDLKVRDIPTPGSQTRLRVYEAREGDVGMFVVDKLPAPPEGREYQLWVGYDEKRENAGAFMPTDPKKGSYHKLLEPPEGFAEYDYVGISTVPEGGEDKPPPTSDPDWLFQSKL